MTNATEKYRGHSPRWWVSNHAQMIDPPACEKGHLACSCSKQPAGPCSVEMAERMGEPTAPAQEPEIIRIPRGFYDDHVERGLPAPDPVRETNRHLWIDRNDERMAELLSDAEYYAITEGFEPNIARTVCKSAQYLLKAVTA